MKRIKWLKRAEETQATTQPRRRDAQTTLHSGSHQHKEDNNLERTYNKIVKVRKTKSIFVEASLILRLGDLKHLNLYRQQIAQWIKRKMYISTEL